MRDTFEYMKRLFREHKDPERDACIFICTMTASFYMSLFVLISYYPVLALIAFAMLAAAVIYIALQWQYKREQAKKEAEKVKNYRSGTENLMQEALKNLAMPLALAPTANHGLNGGGYLYAEDVLAISLTYLRKPEAEPLDDHNAERYRKILNTELWSADEPHIDGDYVDFPLYITKIYELKDGSICFKTIPCIEEKARLAAVKYDKQKREKAAREREEESQALAQFKLL